MRTYIGRVRTNIVMATKASCEDLHWSRPYFMLKGTGDEETAAPYRKRLLQSEGYSHSAVKVHGSEYREHVMLALEGSGSDCVRVFGRT